MFESIHELRKSSNRFVADLNLHVATAIEQSKGLVKLNQKQLKQSQTAEGKSITPLYSDSYAKRKGFKKPDLYLSGLMYSEMDIFADETKNTYDIVSFTPYTKYLQNRYGSIFGISPKNQSQAAKITVPKLRRLWQSRVVF